MKVNTVKAKELILDVLKVGLVPCVVSSPGVGKSAIAAQIAEEQRLELIDIRLTQCDPTDLNGFPTLKEKKASYLPMDTFPIEGDELPEGKRGWLLLLDELPSAALAVQAAAYKLILDKMVGQHKLHPNVAIIAAGNKSTDRAIVNRMGTAMQSRMIHLGLDADVDAWKDWAIKEGIDHRILAYINFKPDALHKFDPNHNDSTFACPRTWEFLSKLIKKVEGSLTGKLPLVIGAVSEGIGREFVGFCDIYTKLPTIEHIEVSPMTVEISDEPSIRYALSGLVANYLNKQNVVQLIKFIERLPIEFQIICLQQSLKREPTLMTEPAITKWVQLNSKELL